MQIDFGKHPGKSSQYVTLKDPSYVRWMFSKENPNGQLLSLIREAKRHIQDLDGKPFSGSCSACKSPATRASVYSNSISLVCWCESCSPYSLGAPDGKLTIIRTYLQALRHVEFTGGSNKAFQAAIIKELVRVKGGPKTLTQAAMLKFLP
ncbi:hypothetical protein ACQ859_16400 [Roseateles chitinivorans]|uniref:hypothetical protein n=1 Tax=Roseateles chitinivorans TaxID=2917965 RepID=UPI003D669FCD